jgi:hypothetical protein
MKLNILSDLHLSLISARRPRGDCIMPGVDALHIGDERTTIGTASLSIGAASLARAHFRHEPPLPLELESAIAAVEDEIMRSARPADAGTTLQTADPDLRELARRCAATDALSVEAVEQAFGQLATRGIPAGGEAAATLVILREVMHHLGIKAVVLRTQPR